MAKSSRNHNRPPAQSRVTRAEVAGAADLRQIEQARRIQEGEIKARIEDLAANLFINSQVDLIKNDGVQGREFDARSTTTIERAMDSACFFAREVWGINVQRNKVAQTANPVTPAQVDQEGRIITG